MYEPETEPLQRYGSRLSDEKGDDDDGDKKYGDGDANKEEDNDADRRTAACIVAFCKGA